MITRVHPVSLILAAMLGLSACAGSTSTADTPGLSAEQQTLRTEASKFNQTVGVPAILGVLAGATLGAVLCRDNKAACAAGGAAVGGAIGGGAGYLVARENTKAASQEEALRVRTAAAGEDIDRFNRVIAATNKVITQHQQNIRVLKAAYRKGEGDLTSAQQERTAIAEDSKALELTIAANKERIAAITEDIEHYGSDAHSLVAKRDELITQQGYLNSQLKKLRGEYVAVPIS